MYHEGYEHSHNNRTTCKNATTYEGVSLTDFCLSKTPDEERKPLSTLEKTCVARQIIESTANLHNKGIAHKDLKTDNILINARGIISIIDNAGITVGKPGDYKAPHKLSAKTKIYCPPEIINHNRYSLYGSVYGERKKFSTLAHDSWSLGIILYELFAGKEATGFIVKTKEDDLILDYNTLFDKLNGDIYLNPKIPEAIKGVIAGFLQYNPNNRLTPKEAITYAVFNNDTYNKSPLALNVEYDKNYKKLVFLEKKLEDLKKIYLSIEIKHLQQQIATIKNRLNDRQYLLQILIINKSLVKYKAEKKSRLEKLQKHKSKAKEEITNITDSSYKTKKQKSDLIKTIRDDIQRFEDQEIKRIKTVENIIFDCNFKKEYLEDQYITADNTPESDNKATSGTK
jgi:serine/threonine protein kinase